MIRFCGGTGVVEIPETGQIGGHKPRQSQTQSQIQSQLSSRAQDRAQGRAHNKPHSRTSGKVLAWALVLAAALALCSVALVVLWSLELPPPTAEVEIDIPASRFGQ